MSSIHTNALIYATGWTVIHSLWQALAIALLLSLVLFSTSRRLANWRYTCSALALLLVLGCSGITFFLYYQQALLQSVVQAGGSWWWVGTANLQPAQQSFWAYWQTRFTIYYNQHLPLIVTVWLSGLAFFLLRLLGGLAYLRQLRHQGVRPVAAEWEEVLAELAQKLHLRRHIALLESIRVQSPLVIGHFKPMILLPIGFLAGLSVDQVEAVLAHELAHVYRRDYLLNLLQHLIEALFYFNPGVWWISNCIRVEREHCCDDIAVRLCANNLEYAKALVNLKEMNQGRAPSLAMAALRHQKHLLTRIQRILHQPINTSDMNEKIVVTALLAFTVWCLNLEAKRHPVQNHYLTTNNTEEAFRPNLTSQSIDTLPAGRITIRTNRNGKRIEAKIQDRKIQELVVDGQPVPATDYNSYEETLNDIIASVPPPPPPPPPFAPDEPGKALPPGVPAPPRAPQAPKAGGYYHYYKDGDRIIIEAPKLKENGHSWKFDHYPDFHFNLKGIDRSIVINGTDSTEIAHFFDPHLKLKGLERMHIKLDSMRMKLDTGQMRRLKTELGSLRSRIKEELGRKLGDNQFYYFDAPDIKMNPDQFRFEMKTDFGSFKRFGSNVKERIEHALIKDELIKPGAKYRFELSDKYLKIDGNKMPDALFDKYRRLYEEGTGIKLEDENKVSFGN